MGRASKTLPDGTRPCSKCGMVKPIGAFRLSRGRPSSYCKACASAHYYSKHRESVCARRRNARYGCDYDAMYKKQNGLCAICDRPSSVLCVDHCHSTGAVRGLLCHACNTGIGLLGDSYDRLLMAAKYLSKFGN